jgi:hypothetical protein
MNSSRRSFLKEAGAIGSVAALGGLNIVSAETKPAGPGKKGMARGLTLLTMRRNGEYRLGAKTSKGILDVKEAAGVLKLSSPATLDDMLQLEEGASVQAVVEAAMKSNAAQKLFLKEENIEYGPLVTRPEKIVCVGLNYRKHAQEIKLPIPKQPVLFNKYNNSLLQHGGTLKLPSAVAAKFDYEIELVIVMGKEARNVSEKDAFLRRRIRDRQRFQCARPPVRNRRPVDVWQVFRRFCSPGPLFRHRRAG